MAFPSVTFTITNGSPNDGSQVAQNFTDCVNAMKDGTKDFSISALTVGGILTLSSTISSALTPTTNTFYDQGTATKGWASLYLGGSSTFTIRLVAPVLGASYTCTLPSAVPAATLPLYMSAAGAVTTQTSANIITSSSCGSFATGSGTATAVTNLSVSITTGGRPVVLLVMPDGSASNSDVNVTQNAGTLAQGTFYFFRGVTQIATFQLNFTSPSSGSIVHSVPPSVLQYVDTPAAGAYTYSVKASLQNGTAIKANFAVLTAYEN